MKVALLHDHFDYDYLIEIIKEMKYLGAPKIRVCHVENDIYQAIEGCHRLRAAAALGITPEFEVLASDTLRSECEDLDWEDGLECDVYATIGGMGDWENTQLLFDD
jgi:hypothetical protein